MGDRQKAGGGESSAGGGLMIPGSKCNKCGKNRNADQNGTLDGGFCDCKRQSDCSIRLGPVPESAFRPPSPLPPRASIAPQFTKEELQAMSAGNTQGTKYEIVSIREKHGEFRKAIPCMPFALAVICCLLNVVLPGIGTLIAGLTVLCGCRTEHESKRTSIAYNMVAALLQLITCPVIVGWIWSVLWGITFVNVSASKGLQDTNTPTPV